MAPSGNPWRHGGRRKTTCRQALRRRLQGDGAVVSSCLPSLPITRGTCNTLSYALRHRLGRSTGGDIPRRSQEPKAVGLGSRLCRTHFSASSTMFGAPFQRPFSPSPHHRNGNRTGSFRPLIRVNIGRWRGSKHPNIAAIGTLKRRPKRPDLRMKHRMAGPG